MECTLQSGVLAHLMDSMFRYGSLWILVEHLEGVRQVMREEEMDSSLMDRAIANGYLHMSRIHAQVQAWVRAFHRLLGYCHKTTAIIILDDEMD